MNEMLEGPTKSNEVAQAEGGHSQYQHQTWTFHNTIGLVLMSMLAFALLVGLLRQQARYQEFVKQVMQPR